MRVPILRSIIGALHQFHKGALKNYLIVRQVNVEWPLNPPLARLMRFKSKLGRLRDRRETKRCTAIWKATTALQLATRWRRSRRLFANKTGGFQIDSQLRANSLLKQRLISVFWKLASKVKFVCLFVASADVAS